MSRDGYELRFAVNYLAPVLLTTLLLPVLARSAGRIVQVGSMNQGPFDLTDLDMTRSYSGAEAYRRSKTALAVWTLEHARCRRPGDPVARFVHPATRMATRMVTESGVVPTSSVATGVRAVVHAVTDPDRGPDCVIFDGTREARAHPQAYDPGFRRPLSELTDTALTPFLRS
jgi:NAD(P)-dependent dehydrogenase (short-subunit alcohol dehydrogenase family)